MLSSQLLAPDYLIRRAAPRGINEPKPHFLTNGFLHYSLKNGKDDILPTQANLLPTA